MQEFNRDMMHQVGETKGFIPFRSIPYSVKSVQCLLLSLCTGHRHPFQNSPWSGAFPPPSPPARGPDIIGIEDPLFDGFTGTMDLSDFSSACMSGLYATGLP